jgi:hypothetical protein
MSTWIVKIDGGVVGWDMNIVACMHTCAAEAAHHLVRCVNVRYGWCGVRHVCGVPQCRRGMKPHRRRSGMPRARGMLLTARQSSSCSIPPCRANCKGNN